MRTYKEAYGPAMRITEQGEADAYFENLVAEVEAAGSSRARAEHVVRHNLGYYAGYYDNETRARVERLFRCAHPVFGAIAEKGAPTPEECLTAGFVLGRALAARLR